MYRRLLNIAVITAFIGTPAMAADMPVKAPPPAPPPAWTWTGFYIGGNIGGAWGHSSYCTDASVLTGTSPCLVGPPPMEVVNQSPSGVVGGGQIGVRWEAPNSLSLASKARLMDQTSVALGFRVLPLRFVQMLEFFYRAAREPRLSTV